MDPLTKDRVTGSTDGSLGGTGADAKEEVQGVSLIVATSSNNDKDLDGSDTDIEEKAQDVLTIAASTSNNGRDKKLDKKPNYKKQRSRWNLLAEEEENSGSYSEENTEVKSELPAHVEEEEDTDGLESEKNTEVNSKLPTHVKQDLVDADATTEQSELSGDDSDLDTNQAKDLDSLNTR